MYIKSIHIENVRCFENENIRFNCPDDQQVDNFLPNVNLFLGNNGSGKSTLLKTIGLVALSPMISQSGFTSYYMVRRIKTPSKLPARIKAGIASSEIGDTIWQFGLSIARIEDQESMIKIAMPAENGYDYPSRDFRNAFYKDSSTLNFIVGYSPSRRSEDGGSFNPTSARKSRKVLYQRVAGLFEDHVNLAPFSRWLPRLKEKNGKRQKHFDEAIQLLNQLLPDGTTISSDSVDESNVCFIQNGLKLPFEALSDGYRSYLGWISDLLYHLQFVCPPDKKLADIPGIVMVDEVDLHLHPEWQRRVVPILARTFPKIQWMLTTHSPIVVGTLYHKNIYIMEQSEDGTKVKQFEERTYGLSAEQILTGSYFGLTTTRAPGAVNRLQELSDKIQQGDKEAVFEMMEHLTRQNLGEI